MLVVLVLVLVPPLDPALEEPQLVHLEELRLNRSQIFLAVSRLPLYLGFRLSDGHPARLSAGWCCASPTLK